MIYLAFGALAFICVLTVVFTVLQFRLILLMMKQHGVVAANQALIPRFRGPKGRNSPIASMPDDMDLTFAPAQPIGLDGSS